MNFNIFSYSGSEMPYLHNQEEVLNLFDVLRTMVIVSRSNFEQVGSGQGPERAFRAFFSNFHHFSLIFCFYLSISGLT